MIKLFVLVALAATAAFSGAAQAKVFPAPSHDTQPQDLDIRKVDASVSAGSVHVKIIVAARTKDNAVYSAFVDCGKKSWQLSAKRAAGDTTIFLFSWNTNKQEDLEGEIAGRTITLSAPASKLGCTKANLRLYVTAEGTNGRNGIDQLPKQKSVLNRAYVRL